MADTKLSALTALTSVADGDLFYVVDISDTTDDAAGSSRKITRTNLMLAVANVFTVGQTITQAAVAGGSPNALVVTAGAHTNLTASTEDIDVKLDLSATKQFATGALTTQRDVVILGRTIGFVGASTITEANTLYVKEPTAGTNATITRKNAIVSEGTLAVRQPGGAPGTDEGQVSNDGSETLIRDFSGKMRIRIAQFGGEIYLGTDDFAVARVTQIGGSGASAWDFNIRGTGVAVKRSAGTNGIGFTSGDAFTAITAGFDSPAAKVLTCYDFNGATAAWLQNSAGVAITTANATNNTTTMSNLSGLTITVIAGRKYSFKMILYCANSLAADGAKFDFDGGTATMTTFRAHGTLFDTALLLSTQTSALATDFAQATMTGDSMMEINGSFTVNAGGTFIPRFACNSAVSGTLTVYSQSFIDVEDMP